MTSSKLAREERTRMTRTLEDGPTRFGIFQAPFHVRNTAPAVNYQRDLELIELADKLGLQEAWVGEHHTGSVEPIGSPELFLAAAVSPSGPTVAGELGLGMINFGGTSQAVFDAVKDHWAICEAEAQKHGQTVSRENWRMSAICHLADTVEQAREDCRYGFEQIWRYLGEISILPTSQATSFE